MNTDHLAKEIRSQWYTYSAGWAAVAGGAAAGLSPPGPWGDLKKKTHENPHHSLRRKKLTHR